jgi:hypothetical protein
MNNPSPILLDEKHDLIQFKITEQPKDWTKPGIRHVRTITKKKVQDEVKPTIFKGNSAVLITISFLASQILNGSEVICAMEMKSEFIISETQKEPSDEFWCDLTERSAKSLSWYHGVQTKGTYLEKQPLAIPDTIKEDCLKQKAIDRQSGNN